MKNLREFLTILQIGYKCRSLTIKLNLNKKNLDIVNFFYKKNWIKIYNIYNNKIIVYLRYVNNQPLFLKIKFISTSGHRKFFSKKSISFFKKNLGGNANILIHTIYGLHTVKYVENSLKIGGEISCVLYK